MNFGRNFRFGKEGRFNLFVRAEFQNVFQPDLPFRAVNCEPTSPNHDNSLQWCRSLNNAGFGSVSTLNG